MSITTQAEGLGKEDKKFLYKSIGDKLRDERVREWFSRGTDAASLDAAIKFRNVCAHDDAVQSAGMDAATHIRVLLQAAEDLYQKRIERLLIKRKRAEEERKKQRDASIQAIQYEYLLNRWANALALRDAYRDNAEHYRVKRAEFLGYAKWYLLALFLGAVAGVRAAPSWPTSRGAAFGAIVAFFGVMPVAAAFLASRSYAEERGRKAADRRAWGAYESEALSSRAALEQSLKELKANKAEAAPSNVLDSHYGQFDQTRGAWPVNDKAAPVKGETFTDASTRTRLDFERPDTRASTDWIALLIATVCTIVMYQVFWWLWAMLPLLLIVQALWRHAHKNYGKANSSVGWSNASAVMLSTLLLPGVFWPLGEYVWNPADAPSHADGSTTPLRPVTVASVVQTPTAATAPTGPVDPVRSPGWHRVIGRVLERTDSAVVFESNGEAAGGYSVGHVEFAPIVPPSFEFSVQFERIDPSVKTVEVIFLGGYFLIIEGLYGFWTPSVAGMPDGFTGWTQLSAIDGRSNKIVLTQRGRKISVVVNGAKTRDFTLAQDPTPGHIGLFFKGEISARSRLKATDIRYRPLKK